MANSLMRAATSMTWPSIRQGVPFEREAGSDDSVGQRRKVAHFDHQPVAVPRRFVRDIGAQPGFSLWRERFEQGKPGLTCCEKTGSLTGRDRMLEEGIFHRTFG